MADLVIKNGKLLTAGNVLEANVVVEGGKIKDITKRKVTADEVIDAKGLYVLPGLIDAHVHFRDPGQTEKEDWESGSRAAASGGVTTVLDMPNNKPSINTAKTFEEKKRIAAKKSIVDFGLYFGAEDGNAGEIEKIKNLAGVKFFLGKSTGDLVFHVRNLPDYLKVLRKRNILAALHCEKTELLEKHKKSEFKYFCETRPAICEAMSIRDVSTAMHNNRIHICHVTSDAGLIEVSRAKKLNDKLTCEVTPQHLFLTKEDELKQGAYLKMFPPLRSKADQTALWHGLRGGMIDIVATDHAPHLREEKELGFEKVPGGVPGVETRLPLVLEVTDLRGLVETCCSRPAEIFGIKNKGMVAEGYDADLIIVDPKREYKLSNEDVLTRCGWTPFDGKEVKGKVEATFVRGQQVYDGEQVIEGRGREAIFDFEKRNPA